MLSDMTREIAVFSIEFSWLQAEGGDDRSRH
jgi:hypothetical protein